MNGVHLNVNHDQQNNDTRAAKVMSNQIDGLNNCLRYKIYAVWDHTGHCKVQTEGYFLYCAYLLYNTTEHISNLWLVTKHKKKMFCF